MTEPLRTSPSLLSGLLWSSAIWVPLVVCAVLIGHRRADFYQNQKLLSAAQWTEELRQHSGNLPFLAGVRSAAAAKRKRLFWPSFELAATPPEWREPRGFGLPIGMGLEVRENPKLLQELFPGYLGRHPSFSLDDTFWNSYFEYPFNAKQWLPSLQTSPFGPYAVFVPIQSCLATWKQFGADILIFGTSETFRAIIPAHLSDYGRGTKSPPRVLQCALGGLRPRELEDLLDRLVSAEQIPARKIFFGVSYWTLRLQALHEAPRPDLFQKELSRWQTPGAKEVFSFPGSPELFPRGEELVRALEDPLGKNWAENEMRYWEKDGSLLIPKGQADLPETARKLSELHRQRSLSAREGQLAGEAATYLQRVLSRMKRLGSTVVIFQPPVSEAFRADEPPSYFQNLGKLLTALSSQEVRISQLDAQTVGLKPSDYQYGTWSNRWDYLNGNHVNYAGAEKITRFLAHEFAP